MKSARGGSALPGQPGLGKSPERTFIMGCLALSSLLPFLSSLLPFLSLLLPFPSPAFSSLCCLGDQARPPKKTCRVPAALCRGCLLWGQSQRGHGSISAWQVKAGPPRLPHAARDS